MPQTVDVPNLDVDCEEGLEVSVGEMAMAEKRLGAAQKTPGPGNIGRYSWSVLGSNAAQREPARIDEAPVHQVPQGKYIPPSMAEGQISPHPKDE